LRRHKRRQLRSRSSDREDAVLLEGFSQQLLWNTDDVPVWSFATGCTADADSDGVCDSTDNCPAAANPQQEDGDDDGVGDACDTCPNTIPGATVDAHGCPSPPIRADLDHDGDVDGDDLTVFKSCASGASVPHSGTPICGEADLDDDADVDPDDFGVYQRCYNGQNVPAGPTCAN
jgi:hypothetical protein